MQLLRDLLAHAEWANAVYFDTWGKAGPEHEELRRRMSHIIGVQQGFLSVLTGQTPAGPSPGPPDSFETLVTRARNPTMVYANSGQASQPTV